MIDLNDKNKILTNMVNLQNRLNLQKESLTNIKKGGNGVFDKLKENNNDSSEVRALKLKFIEDTANANKLINMVNEIIGKELDRFGYGKEELESGFESEKEIEEAEVENEKEEHKPCENLMTRYSKIIKSLDNLLKELDNRLRELDTWLEDLNSAIKNGEEECNCDVKADNCKINEKMEEADLPVPTLD